MLRVPDTERLADLRRKDNHQPLRQALQRLTEGGGRRAPE
jgi:hypothetical protein